jgi:hypothetical protein
MRHVPAIKATYAWLMQAYQTDTIAALASANPKAAIDKLDEKRDAIDRGIFVLLFGQFEVAVTERFKQVRTARLGNPDWTHRRGWDVPEYGTDKVKFETRLAMVMDKQDPAYGKILHAYQRRNHCAHGGTTEAVGSIDQLVNDLYTWSRLLKS